MRLKQVLSGRLNDLKGRIITEQELILLTAIPLEVSACFVEILLEYPLVGCMFELSEEWDESELGVQMKWMTPTEMLEEATESYPGIAAVACQYIPVGICLLGSGDPYFLRLGDEDPPLVRVPHNAVDNRLMLVEQDVELVCSHLSQFFELSEISKYNVS